MSPWLLAFLLQAPGPQPEPVQLPVSFDRIRQKLERPGRFQFPAPRPSDRPVFRVRLEVPVMFFDDPWDDRSITPPWVRSETPRPHFEFLGAVTPEEVRSATLHPIGPAAPVEAVGTLVRKGVRALRERSARREVERVMRDAGIRR